MASCFFVIPYAYFYYEEYEAQGQTKSERRRLAFNYALFFICTCGLLFFFGLFLKPNILPPHIDLEWFENLLTESSKFASIIRKFFFLLIKVFLRWSQSILVCSSLFISSGNGSFHCVYSKKFMYYAKKKKMLINLHVKKRHQDYLFCPFI